MKAAPGNSTEANKTGTKASLVQTILNDVKKEQAAKEASSDKETKDSSSGKADKKEDTSKEAGAAKEKDEKKKEVVATKHTMSGPMPHRDVLNEGQTTWKCRDNTADLKADNRQIPPFCLHDSDEIREQATDALSTVNSAGSKYKSIPNLSKGDSTEGQNQEAAALLLDSHTPPSQWDCRDNLPESQLRIPGSRSIPPYCEHKASVIKNQAEEALRTVNSVPS